MRWRVEAASVGAHRVAHGRTRRGPAGWRPQRRTGHRSYNRHGEAFDRGETFSGVDYDEGVRAAREFSTLAAAHGLSPARAALAWVAQLDGVTTVIPGARSPEQARQNATAGSVPPLGAGLGPRPVLSTSPRTRQALADPPCLTAIAVRIDHHSDVHRPSRSGEVRRCFRQQQTCVSTPAAAHVKARGRGRPCGFSSYAAETTPRRTPRAPVTDVRRAWGMGHGAWGMGHGAWGMGHGAWGDCPELQRPHDRNGSTSYPGHPWRGLRLARLWLWPYR